ncbi:hypothetical protein [Aeromonas dhakensis]
MKVTVAFFFSIIVYTLTYFIPSIELIGDGRYEASLNILSAERGIWKEKQDTKVAGDKFTTFFYLSGNGIMDAAVFRTDGKFISGNRDGKYKIQYTTQNVTAIKIIDVKKSTPYTELLKTVGVTNNESVSVLYRNKKIKIIKLGSVGNTLIYKDVSLPNDNYNKS